VVQLYAANAGDETAERRKSGFDRTGGLWNVSARGSLGPDDHFVEGNSRIGAVTIEAAQSVRTSAARQQHVKDVANETADARDESKQRSQ